MCCTSCAKHTDTAHTRLLLDESALRERGQQRRRPKTARTRARRRHHQHRRNSICRIAHAFATRPNQPRPCASKWEVCAWCAEAAPQCARRGACVRECTANGGERWRERERDQGGEGFLGRGGDRSLKEAQRRPREGGRRHPKAAHTRVGQQKRCVFGRAPRPPLGPPKAPSHPGKKSGSAWHSRLVARPAARALSPSQQRGAKRKGRGSARQRRR